MPSGTAARLPVAFLELLIAVGLDGGPRLAHHDGLKRELGVLVGADGERDAG